MKQYFVVGLIMMAIFLPVRLIFYSYVTHGVASNLGVMSAIAIAMFILIEKDKLGWFGIYFKNRIRRLIFHRVIWVVVFFNILTIVIYGSFLIQIDKVESGQNKEEIDFYMAVLILNHTDGTLLPDHHDLKDIGLYPSESAIESFRAGLADNSTQDRMVATFSDDNVWHFVDLMLAVTLYEYNENTDAWLSHFVTVIVVQEIEALWLLFFYRKVYFKKTGLTWHKDLGIYPKKVKAMVKEYNKPLQKKFEVY